MTDFDRRRFLTAAVASLLWLWCIAGENDGVLPPIDDVAFKLRCAPTKAAETITRLCKAGLIDKFLEDAIELDVDCISDGETSVIGGMLEHIEYAGVHSGDATPWSLIT